MPVQGHPSKDELSVNDPQKEKQILAKLAPDGPNPELEDKVMLIRSRISRIFFLRKFFNYPITINWETIKSLGFFKIVRIGWAYFLIRLFPIKDITSLEDFFISRFGRELYKTFFRDYTEKVWGVPCSQISAQWGAQRIKGLSVTKTIKHAVRAIFIKTKSIEQKNTETSLIDQFMYPKLGPGQMWETVANLIFDQGGELILGARVDNFTIDENQVLSLGYTNLADNTAKTLTGSYYFSSMPVKHLIRAMRDQVPPKVKTVGDGLMYRDFITVGLLLNNLRIKSKTKQLISDNWIYIQENDVKLGRVQIFNNWSPYLLANNEKVWVGLEYFCNKGDELWEMDNEEFISFAINELHKIEIIDKKEVLDSTIIKVPKAYPSYFGTYSEFPVIREFTDTLENLFLIGRNGMHKYNNQDHSMLTAITAVNNIIANVNNKDNIWNVNVEDEYHEEK